jgi:hypothetical protein
MSTLGSESLQLIDFEANEKLSQAFGPIPFKSQIFDPTILVRLPLGNPIALPYALRCETISQMGAPMNLLGTSGLLGLVFLVSGCATMVSGKGTETTEVYNPKGTDQAGFKPLDALAAKKDLAYMVQFIQKNSFHDNWLLSMDAGPSQFVVHYRPGPKTLNERDETHAYTYGSPEGLVVMYEPGRNRYRVQDGNSKDFDFFLTTAKEDAIRFVNAVMSLERYFTTDHTAEIEAALAKFKPIAETYRAKKTKPVIPEDTRKFQIQAENAFDEKRYDDAIQYYQKGIETSPWWPEGHYNLAVILGQEGFLPHAEVQMKKYLALAPDASDARKARDKMYVWEAKLELLPHRAASAPSSQPTSPAPVPEK